MKIQFGLEKRKAFDHDKRKVMLYGYTKGKFCKDCKKFVKVNNYTRCQLDIAKHWKANFEACSLFEERK